MANLAQTLAQAIDPFSEERFLRARNQPFVRPGVSELNYYTHLSPSDEPRFQRWAQTHGTPPTPDYDMRGFWQGLVQGDPHAETGVDPNDQQLHFSDWWKTPLHESFSAESKFAGPGAPQWNERDQLVTPAGRLIFDDRQRR